MDLLEGERSGMVRKNARGIWRNTWEWNREKKRLKFLAFFTKCDHTAEPL